MPTERRAPGVRRCPIYPKVAVLLGDPRLPDPSKRDGRFHDEDFVTRDAMKAAFARMPGYEFCYLDDHTTILDDLRADPPLFVVNFCDTGFRNDPFRELNLPAYLEMLGLPYSGAPPAAMVLALDKSITRALAAMAGIAVPSELGGRGTTSWRHYLTITLLSLRRHAPMAASESQRERSSATAARQNAV